MNEYDDLLATDATQKGNEYDAQLQLDQDQQRTNLRATMLGATKQNPDEYAKAKQLGAQTGLPAPIVARNLKDVDQHATLNEYDKLLTASPTLGKNLQTQDFANVAHDDIPALTQVERATVGDYAAAPLKRLGGSFNDLARFINTVLGAPAVAYDAAKGIITQQPTTEAQDVYFGSMVAPLEQNRQAFELRPGHNIGESVLGGLGDAAGLLSQIMLSGGGAAPEAAGTAAIPIADFLRGAVEHATKAMALPAASAAVNTASDVTAQGADPSTAFHAALVSYLSNTAQGVLPLSAEGGLLKRLLTGGASGVASAEVTRQAMNAVLPTEMQQPLSPDDLIANAITSAAMGGVMGPRAAPAATKLVADTRATQTAHEDAQTIQGILDTAAQSKLRERDPVAFQQFVEQTSQQGGIQEVYVNGETFLQQTQEAGLDPARISPTAASQLPEALATGGDVRIPISELATNVPGSGLEQSLVPHLRTTPEGMTLDEAQQFMQSHATKFQEAADRALADKGDDEVFQRSAEAVKGNIADQLAKANRFTPDVNDQYASLASAFYTSTAARLGVTPEELLRRYPLKIAAESVVGDSRMEQAAQIETPEFKNWFGDSKVVNESGKPLVVYHGTGSDVSQFVQGAAKGAGGRSARLGYFFTDSPRVASDYAEESIGFERTRGYERADRLRGYGSHDAAEELERRLESDDFTGGKTPNVLPVYLSFKNPMIVDFEGRTYNPEKDNLTAAINKAKTEGYDGVIFKNIDDAPTWGGQPSTHYIAFDSSQIKSAIGNRGTFDPNDANILRQSEALEPASLVSRLVQGVRDLFQTRANQPGARGSITFGKDLSKGATISLLKNADLSTFLHESGHFYLEVLNDLSRQADIPPELRADMDGVLQWFGVKGETPDERSSTWNNMSIEEKRPFHEQFARGFESYLFEGRAPSAELQPLFARFRSWLLNVYRSLSSLNVQLNPEVRQVFDRLLATNDQITRAQASRDMAPLFKTADEAGMSPEAFDAYKKLGQDATQAAVDELQTRSLRDMKWLGNAHSRALKELQRDATAKRKALHDEVTKEVRAEPIYAAQRFLKHGEIEQDGEIIQVDKGAKLSLDALKEMYGDAPDAEWRELPKGKYGVVTAEGGLHPDMVAEMFGFGSGDELVRKMREAQPERDVIEGLTDQRMLERYGDVATPEGLQRAADEAIHNDARARFIATELKALHAATNVKDKTVSGGTVDMIVKAAKETAEGVIAQKRIRDVKPNQYAAAETKAAREAMKPNASIEERAAQKRNQIISNQLTRSAQRALDAVEKGRAAILRAVDNPKIDIDYRDQIAALLDRYDLRRITNKEADRRKSLSEWVQSQTDAGLPPVIDDRLLNEANRKPYREMTVEEFKGLVDAIKNIEHLGRLKDKLLTAQDDRNYQTVRDQIVESIHANAKGNVPEMRSSERAILPRVAAMFRGFAAMHRKFASLVQGFDGFKDGGTAWDNLVRNMNMAGDHEAVRNEEATLKLGELLKPILKSETGERMGTKKYFEKAGKSFTREERIGIALNLGNEVNRERVMTGEKLSPEAMRDILSTLSKSDLQFVKNVWAYLDSFRPEIAAKERRLSGVEPKWVEGAVAPQMVEVADKLGIDMGKGGYYPIAYDPNLSSRSAADLNAEVAKQMLGGQYARSQTARGHLKARVESTGRTLRYDFGNIISGHVQQVVHDLAWHEYLIDANRLLKPSGSIDNAVREHYGPEVSKELRNTLTDIATGDVSAKNNLDRAMNWLRHGTTVAGLGLNVSNTLINMVGLTQSMSRIGTQWVLKGMAHWAGDAATLQSSVDKIYEKSDMMRLRGKTQNRELNEIRNKVSGSDSKLQAAWFWLQNRTQLLVDVPTWWGAYEKAMAQNDMTEDKAVALADQAVLDSQGGGQLKDLSGVQRGSAGLKLFTSFYSFFNTTYNLTAEAYGRTNFKKPGEAALFAADMALLYTIPALAGTLVKAAMQGEDNPDKIAKTAISDQISYLFGTMVGVREMAGAAQAVAGVDPGFGYSGPASLRFFADVYKLGKQVGQGEPDAAFWKALNNVGGEVFHYPSGQLNRTAAGIVALNNGESDNPGVLLAGPPPKK